VSRLLDAEVKRCRRRYIWREEEEEMEHLVLGLYRELKYDTSSSQLLVDLSETLNLPVQSTNILWI